MFLPTVSSRVTKALLLDWANAEFPAYYRMVSTHRARPTDFSSGCAALRRMALPRGYVLPRLERFPVARGLDVRSFRRRECFFDARIELRVDAANGTPTVCRGRAITRPESSRCLFPTYDPRSRAFCEQFLFYLVFNVLYEEEISLEEWPDLPD